MNTDHFESLLGPQEIKHRLQMLLYVASCRRNSPRWSGSFVGWQYKRCPFSREVTFAKAETMQKTTKNLI